MKNAYLTAYGNVSGIQTGRIIAVVYSTYDGDQYIYDFVKADYIAVGGYYATKVVIGIQSGAFLNSDNEWVDSVSFSTFSRTDYIMEWLDLTVYN